MSVGLVMRVLRILQPEPALPRLRRQISLPDPTCSPLGWRGVPTLRVPPHSFPQGKFGNLQKMNEIAAFREMA